LKACHLCHYVFESGLTCPGCGGFVPDLYPDSGDDDIPLPAIEPGGDPDPAPPAPWWTPAPTYPTWARPARPPTGTDTDTARPAAPPPPPGRPVAPGPPAEAGDVPRTASPRGLASPVGLAVIGLAVVAMAVTGLLILHRSPLSGNDLAAIDTGIAGTCIVYTADRTRLDHTVACDQPHDAAVVAVGPDRHACPTGTDSLLSTPSDLDGDRGVICLDDVP
jgi:hypothetical protein